MTAGEVGSPLVGRHRELAVLADALAAAGRRGGEHVLVHAAPGMGRSALVHAFGTRVRQQGALAGYGRFRAEPDEPGSAVARALDAVVAAAVNGLGPERDRWLVELHRELPRAAEASLRVLLPRLGGVLPAPSSDIHRLGLADARQLLALGITRMLATVSTYRPVVLVLDDLHLADPDTARLLAELCAAAPRNVLLVGTYRSGRFDPGSWPAGRAPLELAPLSTGELSILLRDLTGPSPDLSVVADEFLRRTGGNPARAHGLLARARENGIVAPSPWPAGSARPAGADWHPTALRALPAEADDEDAPISVCTGPSAHRMLGALACLGGEFDLDEAAQAADRPPDEVADALWTALRRGVLETVDDRGQVLEAVLDRSVRYRFCRDRAAESARNGLTEPDRRAVHGRIGRRLAELGDDRLFAAARHLAAGGPYPDDERGRWAELLARAAERARRAGSHPLALEQARAGLALLDDTGPPVLARRLLLTAAEAALDAGEPGPLAALLDQARARLTDPADRARIALLHTRGLAAEHRLQDALAAGLAALAELGHPVPANPGAATLAVTLTRLALLMRRWPDERLLSLDRCTDPCVEQVQLILGHLRNVSFLARPRLFPLLVAAEVELTLRRGVVAGSPVALAGYGVLLVATGHHARAHRFGEVALRLTERPECRAARPRTQFLRLNFIRHWRHPLTDGLPELRVAYQEAIEAGDREYAGLLAATLLYQSLWVGRPLAEIDATARALVPEIDSERVAALLCRSTQQLCLNLMGRTADPLLLAGESGYDERTVLPVAEREHDEVTLGAAAVTGLVLRYWCADYPGAVAQAERAERHLAGLTGTTNMQVFHLFHALSRIRVAPRSRRTARTVRRALARLRAWADGGPANYACPYALLAGVWARARGDRRRAEEHLDRAVALAERYQLPLFTASAHEEAGALYAELGRTSLSRILIRAAHDQWLNLGVLARSTRLEAAHPWLLGRDLLRPGSATLDPVAVHRLVQSLSDAPSARELAEALLGTAADTTSAPLATLYLADGPRLECRARLRDGRLDLTDPGRSHEPIPPEGVEAVRTGRPVTPPTGPAPGPSALAVPIRMRDTTVGVVHVAHREPGPVFGPAQQDALLTMCGYAAAPLWNQEMEVRLARADERRRSLEVAQARFIPSELLRILDVEDISRVRRGQRVERRMSVLISDIRGYTGLLEGMSVAEAGEMATGFLRAVELPIVAHHGLLQDVRGDEVLAVFETAPDDAVRAGLAMLRALREHNRERAERGSGALRVGIGINTGPVGLGLVGGVNRMALTVIGDSVNLAARVEGATKRYAVSLLISEHTVAELADPAQFDIRRMERVTVVNRSGPVTVYEVFNEDPEPLRAAKRAAAPAFAEAFEHFDAGRLAAARAAFSRCRALLPGDHVAPLHLEYCDAVRRGDLVVGAPAALSQK